MPVLAARGQVEELAKAKLERPKRLRQLAAREWREIDDGTRVFERPAAEVAALWQLSKADLQRFFQVGGGLPSLLLAICQRPSCCMHAGTLAPTHHSAPLLNSALPQLVAG
jgi:hypothetical protein